MSDDWNTPHPHRLDTMCNGMVPGPVRDSQRLWEVSRRIRFARQSGATYKEIAGFLGISRDRVRQISMRYEGHKSPLASHLARKDYIGAILLFGTPDDMERRMLARATKLAEDKVTRLRAREDAILAEAEQIRQRRAAEEIHARP